MESNSEGTSNDSKTYRNQKGNNYFEDDNEESE
jgi:hypothetical protein